MKAKLQNYINNIAMVIDASSSMGHLSETLVKVFDKQIEYLANRSKELNQETRISVYTFSDTTQCICTDMDVLRVPSLQSIYKAYGNTALLDATVIAINDLKEFPQKYVDRAYMVYVISDGEDNRSNISSNELKTLINGLPDNFTIAYLAPSQSAIFEAKKCGFSANNILLWDATTSAGLEKAAKTLNEATNNFMRARSTGVRSTKNLFNLDTTKLKSDVITKKLDALKPADYEILNVRKDGAVIKEFVESWKLPYTVGGSYYQLSKTEKVQASKNIIVQNKLSGKLYTGVEARDLLGLPNYEVKVAPGNFQNYNIYVQSTSVNRKLVVGTQLVYLK